MKKLLLAGVAVIALSSHPAKADLPVIDVTSIGHLLESIGIEGQQLDQLVQTYAEVVQVYNMSTNIWNSVAELVGADQWAAGLNDPAMRNPLPYAAAAHPGYVGGFNDPSGLPFGAQFLGQNTVGGDPSVYNDGTFAGGEILKAVYSLSSMQAVSVNHLQSIETRIQALGDLFAQLANIGTVQETDSLSARLHTELNYANSQVIQGQQAMSSAQLQLAVLENNQRQWIYTDEANAIGIICGNITAAGWTSPACATPTGGGGSAVTGGFFSAVAGTPGAGQAIALPNIPAPGNFLIPGTDTPVSTGG